VSGLGHFRGTCEFCKREVLTGDRAAFRVRGWEFERQAGGANQIVGKERQPNRIAHATCVTSAIRAQKRGHASDQMSLT
jgi:hypothetical protein